MIHKLNWINTKIARSFNIRLGRFQIAESDISKDELLVVFGGHILTLEEVNSLQPEIQHFHYQISETPNLFFGPSKFVELENGEFFNHSCTPNSGFKSAIHLIAMRDIRKGEEITFDYAICMTLDGWKMECSCESEKCRKIITGDDWKIDEVQQKYHGYFQPYIEDKISRFASQIG